MKVITPHTPQWRERFERIAAFLRPALPDNCTFHHVGSTSLPDMPAKDIIDIDIECPDGTMPSVIAALDATGYDHNGDQGIPTREAFRPRPDSPPAQLPHHHLYACESSSPELNRHLAFRNYLLHHSDRARWLATEKRRADAGAQSRDAYIDAKASAYVAITREAVAWHDTATRIDTLETEFANALKNDAFPATDFEERADVLLKQSPHTHRPTGRRDGVHYTPPILVHTMCRHALAAMLQEKAQRDGAPLPRASQTIASIRNGTPVSLQPAEPQPYLDALLHSRICDPAAGDGAFLVGMLETMADVATQLSHGSPGQSRFALMRHIASNCLYGVEIQPLPTRIARLRLRLALSRQARRDGASASEAALPQLDAHIIQGDSLLGTWDTSSPSPPKCPASLPFPEISRHGGFDVVIGNPPYVSFGMRGRSDADSDWTNRIRALYPRSAEYKISTYALFFELALRWLRKGGALCYVTPDSFLTGRYFSKLRNLLLQESALREIVLFEADFWHRRVIGHPVVTVAIRAGAPAPVRNTLATDPETFAAGHAQSHTRPPDALASGERRRFRLLFSPEAERFVETMERDARPLSDYLHITTGIRSRERQQDIVSRKSRNKPPWRPGLVSGSQVTPFRIEWRGHFLRIDPPRLYPGGFDPDIVENPKILIRQTGDSLIAAVDPEGLYHLNNIHSASPQFADAPLRYLCALLNSQTMNRYYQLITLERKRPMAQTRIDILGELPVRIPPPEALRQLDAIWNTIDTDANRKKIEQIVRRAYGLATP